MKNTCPALHPGYTIPKDGESPREKLDQASIVTACVGLYDNEKKTEMHYKLVKRNERFAFKSTFYGGKDEDPRILPDNHNPGPGAHDPDPHFSVPSYLIKDK